MHLSSIDIQHHCIYPSQDLTTLCLDYSSIIFWSLIFYFCLWQLFLNFFYTYPIVSLRFSVALSWPAAYSTAPTSICFVILSLYFIYFTLHAKTAYLFKKLGLCYQQHQDFLPAHAHYFTAAAGIYGTGGLHPCSITLMVQKKVTPGLLILESVSNTSGRWV